jgi:hypothetical protein
MSGFYKHFCQSLLAFAAIALPQALPAEEETWPYLSQEDRSGSMDQGEKKKLPPRSEFKRRQPSPQQEGQANSEKSAERQARFQKIQEFRRRLQNMPPEERRNAIMESPMYQELGPDQRKKLLERLEAPSQEGPDHPPLNPNEENGKEEASKRDEGFSPPEKGQGPRERRKRPMPGQEVAENSKQNPGNGEEGPARPKMREERAAGSQEKGGREGRRDQLKKRFENLTDKEQEALLELRDKLRNLPPEERRQAIAESSLFKDSVFESAPNRKPSENFKETSGKQRSPQARIELSPEQRKALHEIRHQKMSSEERKKNIMESPVFSNFTPEQKQRIINQRLALSDAGREELLKKWEGLPPEQKEKLQEFRKNLPAMNLAEQRKAARKLPFFKDLTDEERMVLSDRFQEFQEMEPEKRQKILSNYERWKTMTPKEREECRTKLKEDKKSRLALEEGTGPEAPVSNSDVDRP